MRVIRPADLDSAAIVVRMRQAVGAKNDGELSAALGLNGASTPSNWRQRNSPPFAFCANIAAALGVSLDWLVFGRGRVADAGEARSDAAPQPVAAAATASAQRITRFVNEWDATRPEEEMIWLEQHLKRTVPEYAAWLADRPAQDLPSSR